MKMFVIDIKQFESTNKLYNVLVNDTSNKSFPVLVLMFYKGSILFNLRPNINFSHLKSILLFHIPQILKMNRHKCSSISFLGAYRYFNDLTSCYIYVNNKSNFNDRQFKNDWVIFWH